MLELPLCRYLLLATSSILGIMLLVNQPIARQLLCGHDAKRVCCCHLGVTLNCERLQTEKISSPGKTVFEGNLLW